MISLIALTFLIQTDSYFPLNIGNEWEYKVQFGNGLFEITQKHVCKEPISLNGVSVVPMEVILDDKPQTITFYRESEGYFWIAGSKETGLLVAPQKMMPVNPKVGDKWEFKGDTSFMGRATPTVIKSKIAGKEKIQIFGKDAEALRITTETNFGTKEASAKMNSTELYLRGVGMVSSRQELSENGRKSIAIFTLIKYKVN